MENETLHIPVVVYFERQPDGTLDIVRREYRDISAKDFAEFLIRGFGITPQVQEVDTECPN